MANPLQDFFTTNGWTKGAGPNYYFPAAHPHLHAGLNGTKLSFLAYSYGGGTGSIQLVKDGLYLRGSLPRVEAAADRDWPAVTAEQIKDQADLLVNQFATLADVRPVARGAIPPAAFGSPAWIG